MHVSLDEYGFGMQLPVLRRSKAYISDQGNDRDMIWLLINSLKFINTPNNNNNKYGY